jgi:protocatechuate 3,4-dioxygenase beta subunit
MTAFRALLVALVVLPLAAAAACPEKPTPRDSEGPFYKANPPLRASLLEPGSKGEKLILSGVVYSTQCKPVPNALLDFWHADEQGEYDNAGYRYRGQMRADAEGRYRLETILPAIYPGRPRHIHVKVQAPGGRVLTTQIYFRDARAGPLEAKLESRDGALHSTFNFAI